VPERPNGTVLKTVVVNSYRGFKSHRFLHSKKDPAFARVLFHLMLVD